MNKYKGIIATTAPCVIKDDPEFFTESLLIRHGMTLPKKIPLVDTHLCDMVSLRVLGRCENLRVEDIISEAGQEIQAIVCDVYFSTFGQGYAAQQEVDQGNVWGLSIGCDRNYTDRIPRNEARVIDGQVFVGGQQILRSYDIVEASLCVKPADKNCKIIITKQEQTK